MYVLVEFVVRVDTSVCNGQSLLSKVLLVHYHELSSPIVNVCMSRHVTCGEWIVVAVVVSVSVSVAAAAATFVNGDADRWLHNSALSCQFANELIGHA